MIGTIAITDIDWFEYLSNQQNVDEVNFWTPSSHWAYNAPVGSPFIFKLKAKYNNAIVGFAYYTKFSRLPDWLAWESFGTKNGNPTLMAMQEKIGKIRKSIDYRSHGPQNLIGCILLSQPTFFKKEDWIEGPVDWPKPNLRPMKYDLSKGEGFRIFQSCLKTLNHSRANLTTITEEPSLNIGNPSLITSRLGQGLFRISVLDAYDRSCSVTHEHSLPALEAAHIKPFADGGPSQINNGILLRADFHRLFDQGYMTITNDFRLNVSPRLKMDFDNGKSYYPLHGHQIHLPHSMLDHPAKEFISWHNENIYKY